MTEYGAAERLLREVTIMCATCNRPARKATIVQGPFEDGATLRVACHGAFESERLPEVRPEWERASYLDAVMVVLRKARFLRNWAGYTIRPKHGEGRRL